MNRAPSVVWDTELGDECSDEADWDDGHKPTQDSKETRPDSRHPITHVAPAFFFRLSFCTFSGLPGGSLSILLRGDFGGVSALLCGVVGAGAGVFVVCG
ncbi:hypothetical protein, partial [Mycobacteroides abscessus]